MATAKQIVALLQSHLEGNGERFLSIALQVAAAEARQGHREIADDIKRLVDKTREGATLKIQGLGLCIAMCGKGAPPTSLLAN
jgi:hypothetical protein